MAETTSDERTVRITTTRAELTQLLGDKAQEAGLIDFDPDDCEVHDNGDGFELVFTAAYATP